MKKYIKSKQLLQLFTLLTITLLASSFYSRKEKDNLNTHKLVIQTDSLNIEFYQVNDQDGLPLLYYRNIDQYPCDDSVCARMQVRIYWDIWGNFLKLGLDEGQELTKIGHKPFDDKDYEQLHKLLNNPKAGIQYYQLENLTDKESEVAYYSIDAVSGATIQDVRYESVRGAVKTCYTLWKIVHEETVHQIRKKTMEYLLDSVTNRYDPQENDLQDQLRMMTALIRDHRIPEQEISKVLHARAASKPVTYILCLLELDRQSENTDNSELKKLAGLLENGSMISRTAIYNYLLQVNYRDKNVRKHQLSLACF